MTHRYAVRRRCSWWKFWVAGHFEVYLVGRPNYTVGPFTRTYARTYAAVGNLLGGH